VSLKTPIGPLLWLIYAIVTIGFSAPASAQDEDGRGRSLKAAAKAYDRATEAYLAEDYDSAAQWFETANRMAPSPAALIQAARAHDMAEHGARAATLGLRLTTKYPDDETATQIGQDILDRHADKLVRVDVECEGCTVELDGSLLGDRSFFLEPDVTHRVTASFETGSKHEEVQGAAGEVKSLSFEAPPPPPPGADAGGEGDDGSGAAAAGALTADPRDQSGKPLPPIVTWIGAGVTAAMLVGSIVVTLDVNSNVESFTKKAKEWQACPDKESETCMDLKAEAQAKLDAGAGKETLRTVMWIGTGVAAAGTAAIALFLTDWSGGDAADDVSLMLVPNLQQPGVVAGLRGRF